jgi:hypothetical protein
MSYVMMRLICYAIFQKIKTFVLKQVFVINVIATDVQHALISIIVRIVVNIYVRIVLLANAAISVKIRIVRRVQILHLAVNAKINVVTIALMTFYTHVLIVRKYYVKHVLIMVSLIFVKPVTLSFALIVLNTPLVAAIYVMLHIASSAESLVAAMIAFNLSVQNV